MVSTRTPNTIVYNALRKNIVAGNLRPGARPLISDLAKRYSSSAMAVQEALSRFYQDGRATGLIRLCIDWHLRCTSVRRVESIWPTRA